jgi:uncharacterized protein
MRPIDLAARIAAELRLAPGGVAAALELFADGNTVPFVARYRKERTGGLDEVQLRAIDERSQYLIELEERRAAVLASVRDQGKLSEALEASLRAAASKSELEDLYAPYRARRRTRAQAAREKGLEPLALLILGQGSDGEPLVAAGGHVNLELQVASAEEALAGAKDIVAETVADTAAVRAFVRGILADEGELVTEVVQGKNQEPTKFEQYYAFRERVKHIPSHRFLAIRRGEAEGVIRAQIVVAADLVLAGIARLLKLDEASPWATLLREAIADGYRRLLAPSIENDLRAELKQRADQAAVEVFADNLRNLLLAAPLGGRAVLGIDPGVRTGCKCAAVGTTGKFEDTATLFISQGESQLARAKEDLLSLVRKHTPVAIAVGNGTGGREAEAFVRRTLKEAEIAGVLVVAVNEAGASVYSASDLAREEFPELDLTIRGAISIARRLQDPLAELVKVEPRSIGVGQYQHDVHQSLLAKKLGDVVESCVNHVGVELNTASAELLQHVAGIGPSVASKIVAYRDGHGGFSSRRQLLEVSGVGPKAFEQAAGFLRVRGGQHPLDASAVHPEAYAVVERMAADLGVEVSALVGNQEMVDRIDLSRYVGDGLGEPSLRDIAAELVKPGRDPRDEFAPPRFREDVTTVEDLKPGMVLEGVVTNVTAFGAFVDVGVHQDGLVHVSQLSSKFVKEPSEVVRVGQRLQVRVMEVDLARKRIGLSARLDRGEGGGARAGGRGQQGGEAGAARPGRGQGRGRGRPQGQGPAPEGAATRAGEPGEHASTASSDGGPGEQANHRRRPRGSGPRQAQGAASDRGGDVRGPERGGHGQGGQRGERAGRGQGGANGEGGGRGQGGQRGEGGARGQDGPRGQGGSRGEGVPRGQGGEGGPRGEGAPRGEGVPRGERGQGWDRGGRDDRDGGRSPRAGQDRGARPQFDDRGDRGPRRDQRGEFRDGPRASAPMPSGFGVSGFVNNPFAKLAGPRDKK